ncbi:hypothetical protein [Aquimarina pacifica]|uniref:hypothetical protein n=1 Tax=Aquimarina pacifica TaxID=1296415 RepID=UPI00055091DE|nr:hypothetical protein [Aquimarina pacifica]
MKLLYKINQWSFILTLLLYLTIYFGLIAQIVLGGLQLLFAIIMFFRWGELTITLRKHLLYYSTLVVLYAMGYLVFKNIVTSYVAIACITFIPMSIAGYFVYITYKTQEVLSNQPSKETKITIE